MCPTKAHCIAHCCSCAPPKHIVLHTSGFDTHVFVVVFSKRPARNRRPKIKKLKKCSSAPYAHGIKTVCSSAVVVLIRMNSGPCLQKRRGNGPQGTPRRAYMASGSPSYSAAAAQTLVGEPHHTCPTSLRTHSQFRESLGSHPHRAQPGRLCGSVKHAGD